MKTLLFVHIPKTAGTSFRSAATKYFGSRKILNDYGAHAPETSKDILENTYKRKDYWPVYNRIAENDIRMLCGHVPARRYIHGLGVDNTVVFFREPVQRLYSEFQHFVRNKGYEGTFRDFISLPGRNNAHLRQMENVPLQALGFVGLTEEYDASLEMLNHKYGTGLKPLIENTGRTSLKQSHQPSQEDVQLALEVNKKDVQLYNLAVQQFKQRYDLFKRKLPFAHAKLIEVSAKRVAGWAWTDEADDEPLKVRVRINGAAVAEVVARAFRSQLCYLAPPRGACVSFSASYSAKAGDLVDCEVISTGQVFPARPVKIQ